MSEEATADSPNRDLWYTIFAVGHPALVKFQELHRKLPSPPRCKMCFAPFRGLGSIVMGFMKKGPSNRNPQYCSACDHFMRSFPGGAEVNLSMVFVDVRGSTALAETMTPTAFSRIINKFYDAATKAVYETDGFVIDLVGDQVVAVYPPGFSGELHAKKAVQAAEALLRLNVLNERGAQLQVGVGVHTGVVYMGTITGASAGVEEIRAVGDNVNTAARLASVAGAGEALVSDATCEAAGPGLEQLEYRTLELKGKNATVGVRVMREPARS